MPFMELAIALKWSNEKATDNLLLSAIAFRISAQRGRFFLGPLERAA